MEEILTLASQYGALGLMLLASFWYINKRDKERNEERRLMNERFDKMHTEALEVTRTNTTAMIELTQVIRNGK